MDWSIAHSLNTFLFHHDGIEDPVLAYDTVAEVLFLGMLLVVCALARHARWTSVRRAGVHAGFSAGLGLLIAKIITELYYRPRPFVTHPHAVHLFQLHAADASFPSDHATASIAIATALLLRRKWAWGWISLAFAVLLCFARVALGFHYPTDVLGGAAIGVLVAVILWQQPLRGWSDAVSDWAGGHWDRATDLLLGRLQTG